MKNSIQAGTRRRFLSAIAGFGVGALGACSGAKPAARKFVTTRFGRIAHFDQGSGGAALFLHGFPLNGFQWRGVIERLAPHRRCLAPDFMGLGFTEVAAGQSLLPSDQTDMLIAFLDALGVGAVDVVANDSGGSVAQLLVARVPDRVRSLLLTNCDTELDSPPAALLPVIALAHQNRYAQEWLVPWRNDYALARSAEGLGGMCYSLPGHPTDEALETYLGPLVASRERIALTDRYAISLERNPLTGIEAALRGYQKPVRIIWGSADTIFDSSSPEYLQRTFPNCESVRRIERGKLFFPEEYPDIVADEAKALWRVT